MEEDSLGNHIIKSDEEAVQSPTDEGAGSVLSVGAGRLENPKLRKLIWASARTAVDAGAVLAKLSGRNHHHQFLRKFQKIPERRNSAMTLPGVRFFKQNIGSVPCRIYVPNSEGVAKKFPTIVYFHGGGWAIASPRLYHPFTLKLCRDTAAIVISVNYRKAPENPYPAPLDDCVEVTQNVLNSDKFDSEPFTLVDTSRVMLMGDSAGGNLAGAVALELIRQGDLRIHTILMICPVTQAVTVFYESYDRMKNYFKGGLAWFVALYAGIAPDRRVTKSFNQDEHLSADEREYWLRYVLLGDGNSKRASASLSPTSEGLKTFSQSEPNSPSAPKFIVPDQLAKLATTVRAWPSLAEDEHLRQLPAIMVQSCSHDVLMSENVAFVERLRKSGAKHVQHSHVEGAEHCEIMADSLMHHATKSGSQCYAEALQFIKNNLCYC